MSKKYNKLIYQITAIALILLLVISSAARGEESRSNESRGKELRGNELGSNELSKQASQIEAGTYILVSFSMNNQSLRNYFLEAQKHGAILVMQGLSGEKHSRNRFAETKAKTEKAKINIEINPTIFEQLNVKQVPVIAVVNGAGRARKVSGHITLEKALEIMEIKHEAKS